MTYIALIVSILFSFTLTMMYFVYNSFNKKKRKLSNRIITSLMLMGVIFFSMVICIFTIFYDLNPSISVVLMLIFLTLTWILCLYFLQENEQRYKIFSIPLENESYLFWTGMSSFSVFKFFFF